MTNTVEGTFSNPAFDDWEDTFACEYHANDGTHCVLAFADGTWQLRTLTGQHVPEHDGAAAMIGTALCHAMPDDEDVYPSALACLIEQHDNALPVTFTYAAVQ